MWFIFDLAIVAIVAIYAFLSAKKGFVRTLVEIVGFIIIILLANKFSPILADYTYNKFIEPAVVGSLQDIQLDDGTIKLPENILPDFVNKFLGEDFSISNLEEMIAENFSDSLDAAITSACDTVIKPIVTDVLNLLISVVITMILLFVVKILAGLFNKLLGNFILGKTNKILGAVLGMIKGVAIAIIVCSIISAIVGLTKNGIWIFNQSNIDKTIIFKLLCFPINF